MKSFSVLFLLIFSTLFVLQFNADVETTNQGSSIVQLSSPLKKSDVRLLKAMLILPCDSSDNHRQDPDCKPRVEVRAWLDWKDSHEMFLLIDEVHVVKERKSLLLVDPYLIQVTMIEQNSFYPLASNQVINISCDFPESLQRREAKITKNGKKYKKV